MMRPWIALLMFAACVSAGAGRAQDAVRAPQPGQAAAPPPDGTRSPTAYSGPPELPPDIVPGSNSCSDDFAPLRKDAEEKGGLTREALERHAPRTEACGLIESYSRSEYRLIEFVEDRSARCQVEAQAVEKLKAGHERTKALRTEICARRLRHLVPGFIGAVGDFGDPSFASRPRH